MAVVPIVAHICSKGAYIFVSDISEKQLKYIQSTFTIRNKTIMGYFDIIKCYKFYSVGNRPCIVIPRFGVRFICKKIRIITQSQIKRGLDANYTITSEFKGNQQLVFDELMATYFSAKQAQMGLAGCLINLAAGQGKSFISLQIIAKLKTKTFIITHNELILKQWHKIIIENMPNVSVGLYYGKSKTNNADITIGIINSALNYDNWNEIGLCIFDEAHLYSSKGRAEIYDKCQSYYMLALSATPLQKLEQNDNRYKIIQWQIGPIINAAELPGYTVENIAFTCQINKIIYKGHPDYIHTLLNEKLEIVSNPKMINQIIEDPYRKKLVISLAREIIEDPNKNLFIFANRRAYLDEIHTELVNFMNPSNILFLTNDEEEKFISTIMGGAAEDKVNLAKQHSRLILSTYGYIGTGFSIIRFNSLIFATPFKTGSEQFCGRIFRLGSDYTICRQIYDIVDISTTLKSQWYKRKSYYNGKEYPIVVRNYKWTDFQ